MNGFTVEEGGAGDWRYTRALVECIVGTCRVGSQCNPGWARRGGRSSGPLAQSLHDLEAQVAKAAFPLCQADLQFDDGCSWYGYIHRVTADGYFEWR